MNWKAVRISAGLSILFVIVYPTSNWFASTRQGVGSFYFAFERHIPFVPIFILPYLSIDLFFIAAPFVCLDDQQRRQFAKRIALAILIAGAFFLLMPMRFAFARPPAAGWQGVIFNWFRAMDLPFNQFPSLHIAQLVILLPVYWPACDRISKYVSRSLKNEATATMRSRDGSREEDISLVGSSRFSGRFFVFGFGKHLLQFMLAIWFILIALSTLLTYQHQVIDLVGGFALGVVCIYLVPGSISDLSISTKNYRVGFYYFCGSMSLAALGLLVRPAGLFLLWPALSMAIVALGYWQTGARVFHKHQGRLPLATSMLLCPILLGQRLSLLHYRRQCNAWDTLTDRVWIGRKLSDAEARKAIEAGVRSVLDLTGEFSEASPFLALRYLQLPILDLTAPSPAQLEQAVAFIETAEVDGIVFIHCKIGFSRTAAVAGAYLLNIGAASTSDQAIAMLRQVRPNIVIRPEAVKTIEAYAKSCPSTADEVGFKTLSGKQESLRV